jgi:hypothetical protein
VGLEDVGEGIEFGPGKNHRGRKIVFGDDHWAVIILGRGKSKWCANARSEFAPKRVKEPSPLTAASNISAEENGIALPYGWTAELVAARAAI